MKISPGFRNVKVGDVVAAMKTRVGGSTWTGALHSVTKVAEKRFMVGGNWIDKMTGRQVGGVGGYYYTPATSEMIAENDRKRRERDEAEQRREAFYNRPDYKLASEVRVTLDEMSDNNHPLDRLTLAEWQKFHDKLTGATSPNGSAVEFVFMKIFREIAFVHPKASDIAACRLLERLRTELDISVKDGTNTVKQLSGRSNDY